MAAVKSPPAVRWWLGRERRREEGDERKRGDGARRERELGLKREAVRAGFKELERCSPDRPIKDMVDVAPVDGLPYKEEEDDKEERTGKWAGPKLGQEKER